MFSFFKKFRSSALDNADNDKDENPSKMSLEERKTWRSIMINRSVQDVFQSLGITPKMYKYRVMPVDNRNHYFAIMVETNRLFSTTGYTTTKKLLDIEIALKTRTFEDYSIVVDGVFWKTDETVNMFDISASQIQIPSKHKKTIAELREIFADKDKKEHTVREPFKVGNKTYDTDLSPLSPE